MVLSPEKAFRSFQMVLRSFEDPERALGGPGGIFRSFLIVLTGFERSERVKSFEEF